MYEAHFGLERRPFQMKPDGSFLFPSRAHAYARAMLAFTAWNRDGIAVLVGEAGVGKTILIQGLVKRLDPSIAVIVIHQPRLFATEFLRLLLSRFGVDAFRASKAQLIVLLHRVLARCHELGRPVLLIVDEAQHLPIETLEELRFLTEIHFSGEPAFNLILVGQPRLLETIESPAMAQLAQRARLRYTLSGLPEEEVPEYIRHRLQAAGARNLDLFDAAAVALIARLTRGNPRLINILCDAALVAAYLAGVYKVMLAHVRRAADELGWALERPTRPLGEKPQQPRVQGTPQSPHAATAARRRSVLSRVSKA